jgi:phosphinothricin acetyltransferase
VPLRARPPRPEDAEAIARIYNEGIAGRLATFEIRERTAEDIEAWFDAGFPLVLVEDDGGAILAWASAPPYRPHREAYRGVGDFSVYVAGEARGRGAGRAAMEALAEEARARGFWKLVGRIFPENRASLALCRSLGFREVGVYRRHARLDGVWRDVVVVELLLDG